MVYRICTVVHKRLAFNVVSSAISNIGEAGAVITKGDNDETAASIFGPKFSLT